MKKLLISGGAGKLAQQIIRQNSEYKIIAPTHAEMDVSDMQSIERYISAHDPDIFLHAAAYTRPMLKHQLNPDLSIETNIIGTANVVLACMKRQIKLVYISTDYVYPGTHGNYREDDPVCPYSAVKDGLSKYGWSKLGGECATMLYDNSLILRMCMCNSPFPHAKAVSDIKKSYIFEDEAALIVLRLLGERGIINVGGKAQTVYDFAQASMPDIQKISAKDLSDVNMAPDTSMNINKMIGILDRQNAEEESNAKKR